MISVRDDESLANHSTSAKSNLYESAQTNEGKGSRVHGAPPGRTPTERPCAIARPGANPKGNRMGLYGAQAARPSFLRDGAELFLAQAVVNVFREQAIHLCTGGISV